MLMVSFLVFIDIYVLINFKLLFIIYMYEV